jgi:predicted NodU family carbamoyl transferase
LAGLAVLDEIRPEGVVVAVAHAIQLDRVVADVVRRVPYLTFERLLETYFAFAPAGLSSFLRAMPVWLGEKLHIQRHIRKGLDNSYKKKIVFTSHHESHAASAFFPSPFEEAAILTMDGVGEWSTTTIGHGRGNKIKLTHELRFPHSLGLLYSAFTYFSGFKVNSGEYKLMGSCLTFPIGLAVSSVVLTTIYFVVVTPIALAMRLAGRDTLSRRLDRSAKSYWRPLPERTDGSTYFRQS